MSRLQDDPNSQLGLCRRANETAPDSRRWPFNAGNFSLLRRGLRVVLGESLFVAEMVLTVQVSTQPLNDELEIRFAEVKRGLYVGAKCGPFVGVRRVWPRQLLLAEPRDAL